MKKIICCALIAVLLCCSALASAPSLSENMFKYAKASLAALADGSYEKLVANLPFSGMSPSAKEWRSLAEKGFSDLVGSDPQTKYAVAYYSGGVWKIAVPVSAPSSGNVETLVLISEDGSSFTGYSCAPWHSVESEYRSADYVTWNEEYSAAASVFVEFDE